jgi:hypothetical protein
MNKRVDPKADVLINTQDKFVSIRNVLKSFEENNKEHFRLVLKEMGFNHDLTTPNEVKEEG